MGRASFLEPFAEWCLGRVNAPRKAHITLLELTLTMQGCSSTLKVLGTARRKIVAWRRPY